MTFNHRTLRALLTGTLVLAAGMARAATLDEARFARLRASRPDARQVAVPQGWTESPAAALAGLEFRDGEGFELVYLPAPRALRVKLPLFPTRALQPWWYNPVSGQAVKAPMIDNDGVREFAAPAEAHEWVLVLEDLFRTLPPPGEPSSAPRLVFHSVRLDGGGAILPWREGPIGDAYDNVVRATARFWMGIRKCDNGVPYYLQHQVWRPDHDDARGIGGDQIPMAMSSWALMYNYTGDPAFVANAKLMADYWLAHGLSGASAQWANLPFPYNVDLHSGRYDGDMRAGVGTLQPDKAASFGAELIVLFKQTGERRYLDAARRMAETLAARIVPGDGDNSPWPFRVDAAKNTVHEARKAGATVRASYTANYSGALRLFDDLIALKEGDAAALGRARGQLAAWLKHYPLRTNKWGPFFEDIPTGDYSDTEINADTMATYILLHPEWDERWREQARGILEYSGRTFDNPEFARFGVTVTNEQTVYRVPGNSHTTRHAATMLLYAEKTGDTAGKPEAIRKLNWATYFVAGDGMNRYLRDDVWLTDGYGDYIRHYLRAMAAAPELAPPAQNHLLRTTSVLRSIQYGDESIRYEKFDAASQERFKLGSWVPAQVSGGKMEWDATSRVLTVKATDRSVTIRKLSTAR